MIKIEAKKGKKILKKEIKVGYIDFNVNKNGKWIEETVNAPKLKQLFLDNNIEYLHFINKAGDKFQLIIEIIRSLSFMNSTVFISAFCPDLFVVYKKNIFKKIGKANIKISPIIICFEDTEKIIKIQKFLFPRNYTIYMKAIWLQNNGYKAPSNNIKVKYIKNMAICKYSLSKQKNYIYNY
ncbi:hypothetical protein ACWYRQ_21300 [Clostridioides difficile]